MGAVSRSEPSSWLEKPGRILTGALQRLQTALVRADLDLS